MSVNNFKPEIWLANIDVALKKNLVYAALGNKDYEGALSFGTTVKVNEVMPFSTTDYTQYSDVTFTQLETSQRFLTIDQQKYIAKTIDDIDMAQANVDFMTTITSEIGYSFGDQMDSYIAGLYAQAGLSDATLLGSSATPIEVNSANVDDYFLAMGEIMTKNNVPKVGRFVVIPAWMETKLTLAMNAVLTTNNPTVENGFLGRAYNFDFYTSNNVSEASAGTNAKILAGIKGRSWSVAQQIVKVEAGRHEKQFGDFIKGLHVYGAKIMRPDLTAVGYVTKKAEA
jgi:hypothetical protein